MKSSLTWAVLLLAGAACVAVAPASAVPINPGDILVADRDAAGGPGAVIHVNPGSGVQTVISSGGSFITANGIIIDTNGDILVADPSAFGSAGGVIRVDPISGVQTPLSSGAPFINPYGLAVAVNGALLVVDDGGSGPGMVYDVDRGTGIATPFSNDEMLLLVNPTGIAVAPSSGRIFVTDVTANAVFEIDQVSGAVTLLSSGGFFVNPAGITVAPNGDIYVADFDAAGGPGAVIKVDPVSGAQQYVSTGGNFFTPYGIKWSMGNRLYVADLDAFGLAGGVIEIDPSTGVQTPISTAGLFVNPAGITTGGDLPVPTQQKTLGEIKDLYR